MVEGSVTNEQFIHDQSKNRNAKIYSYARNTANCGYVVHFI